MLTVFDLIISGGATAALLVVPTDRLFGFPAGWISLIYGRFFIPIDMLQPAVWKFFNGFEGCFGKCYGVFSVWGIGGKAGDIFAIDWGIGFANYVPALSLA